MVKRIKLTQSISNSAIEHNSCSYLFGAVNDLHRTILSGTHYVNFCDKLANDYKPLFLSQRDLFCSIASGTSDLFRHRNPQNNNTILHELIFLMSDCQRRVTEECRNLLRETVLCLILACPELVTSLNDRGELPIDLCCYFNCDNEIFNILLKRTKVLSTNDLSYATSLPIEIAELVKSFLGSPLLFQNPNRSSSLHLLLDTDQTFVNWNFCDLNRLTTLIECEKKMLEIGDLNGNTPLHYLFDSYENFIEDRPDDIPWMALAKLMIKHYSPALYMKNDDFETPLHKLLKICDLSCDQTFNFVHDVCKDFPTLMCEVDDHNRTILHLILEAVDEFENPWERCRLVQNVRKLLAICPCETFNISDDLDRTPYDYAMESWPDQRDKVEELFFGIV